MELGFNELKKKSVINVLDGRDLGKICDLIFTYPEGRIKAIIVPGKRNAFFKTNELIIDLRCIEKIGNDAVLVRLHENACEAARAASADDEEE